MTMQLLADSKHFRNMTALRTFVVLLVALLPATTTAEADSGINVLLMGVDKAQGGDQFDIGVRPDALMVLHLDPETGSCRLLGIPRDSRVEVPNVGMTKINHALSQGGIPLQETVVENFLDIEIDHIGLVDYQGLIGVVEAVGGITVVNPYTFEHEGTWFAEGDIILDGEDALAFSRYRHGEDGDFGRIHRQQLVIQALLAKLGSQDPIQTLPKLLGAVEGHFRTDMTPAHMISLAMQFQDSCTPGTLETRTLTGENAMFTDPLLNQSLWYVVIDPQEMAVQVRWLLTGQ